MSFERPEHIKKLMNRPVLEPLRDEKVELVQNSPVCKECAEYYQGEII